MTSARGRRAAAAAAATAVSVVSAYLALRNVQWSTTWRAVRSMDAAWIVPPFLLLVIWTYVRVLRWRALFRPGSEPPVGALTKATILGLFFNNVLPARAGELARVLALRRYCGTSRVETAGTIIVERTYDVACLLALLLVALPWLPHIRWARTIAIVSVATVVLAVVAVGGATLLERRLTRRAEHGSSAPIGASLHALVESLGHGFTAMRTTRQAIRAVIWTVASWLILGLGCWVLMRAFALHLSVLSGLLVVVAIGFSFAIPAAPGGVGVFEAAGLAAMNAYGISTSRALGYVLVLHMLNVLPYLVAGGALLLTGGGAEAAGQRRAFDLRSWSWPQRIRHTDDTGA